MEREASVKLTLDNSQYIVQIRRAGDETESTVKRASKSASALGAGFKGASHALSEVGSKAKEVAKLIGGLAAGFSVGDAAQKAIGLRERFKDIQFQMTKNGDAAKGMAVDWQSLQSAARDAGRASGQSTEEMADTLSELYLAVGDKEYAVGGLNAIGAAAKASRHSVQEMGDVAGMLKEKFGATVETLPEMLAAVVSKTDEGGLALSSMKEKFGLLAGEAVDAGFKGKSGLSEVLGMLNALDDRLGEKSIPSFKKMFQTLKDGSASLKALEKDSGITFKVGATGAEKIRQLMGSDKGRAAMAEKLGGDARVVFDELAKPFKQAFDSAKASGADSKKATKAGMDAFDAAMGAMSKQSLSFADVQERAADAAKSPQARLRQAMEDFEEAISTPEMFAAIDSLARDLPKLASVLAKVVGFTMHSPVTAGIAGVAAVGGGGFVKAAAQQMVLNVGKSFAGQLKTATEPASTFLANKAASTLAANPALKAAGAVLGVAAAAAIGVEIGKNMASWIMSGKEESQKASDDAMNAVGSDLSTQEKKNVLAKAKDNLEELEKGPGLADTLFGGLTAAGNKLGLVSDDDNKSANDSYQNDLERARKRVRELEQDIKTTEAKSMKQEEEKKQPPKEPVNAAPKRVKLDDMEDLGRILGRHVAAALPKPEPPTGNRGPTNPPPP